MKSLTIIIATLLSSSLSFAQYCNAGPNETSDSNLGDISLIGKTSSIKIISSCPGSLGTKDLTTSQSADLVANETYTLNIDFNTCGGNYDNGGEAWIDYNKNQKFEGSESIGQWFGNTSKGSQNFTFTIPNWVGDGATRIRFMQQEGFKPPFHSCCSFNYGAVIDAKILLSGGTNQILGVMDPSKYGYNPFATVNDASGDLDGNPSDCIGAIPLCNGSEYSEATSVDDIGDVTNEFSSSNTCIGVSGITNDVEVNSIWYTFTVPNTGTVSFTITPNNLNDDYDWVVFDITAPDHSCETMFADGSISCNFSGTPGETGPNGQPGGQNEPPFTAQQGNTYAVCVTNWTGSTDGYSIDFAESEANIYVTDFDTDDQEICYGDSADLRAQYQGPTFDVLDYIWSPGNLVVDSTKQFTTTIGIREDTTVFYVSLNLGACDFQDSVIVYAFEAESEFNTSYDSIISPVVVDIENLSSENTVRYFWDFDNGDTSDSRDPVEQFYYTPGEYNVMLVIENEIGCVDTAYQTIAVPEFSIPNVITPNGDGVNDTLIVTGLKELTNLHIYNRWGKLVTTFRDFRNNFDGGDLSDGVYFYQLTRQDGSAIEEFKGWITIKR